MQANRQSLYKLHSYASFLISLHIYVRYNIPLLTSPAEFIRRTIQTDAVVPYRLAAGIITFVRVCGIQCLHRSLSQICPYIFSVSYSASGNKMSLHAYSLSASMVAWHFSFLSFHSSSIFCFLSFSYFPFFLRDDVMMTASFQVFHSWDVRVLPKHPSNEWRGRKSGRLDRSSSNSI